METALLQYPIDEIYEPLPKILKRKGYSIISISQSEGTIKAHKRRFLKKDLLLHVNLSKLDANATRVDLSINSDLKALTQKLTFAKSLEQELWNSIYNYF